MSKRIEADKAMADADTKLAEAMAHVELSRRAGWAADRQRLTRVVTGVIRLKEATNNWLLAMEQWCDAANGSRKRGAP